MNYSEDLEERLGVKLQMISFENTFDQNYQLTNSSPLDILRKIKVHLYKQDTHRRELFKGTYLNSTDCLTLAVLENLLADRKGLETVIARPDKISRYFHAVILYGPNNTIFKVSGRNRNYDCKVLSPKEVENRLKYIRPVFNFVNTILKI